MSQGSADNPADPFEALVALSGEAVWTSDGPHSGFHPSASWCRFTGQAEAEQVGLGWLEAVYPEDRPAAMEAWHAAAAAGDAFQIELRLRHAGGDWRWVQLRGRPLGAGWIGMAVDIHARRQGAERLRETEERMRLANLATDDAIWDWDLTCDRVRWNEALHRRFGHHPADVGASGDWWIENIHPEDRLRIVESIHEVIDGAGSHWSDEYRFRRGDGSYAHILDRGYTVRAEDGQPLRMIGAMQDLTHRIEMEQQLRESEEELLLVADNLPILVAYVDADTRYRFLNKYYETWFGRPMDEMLGRRAIEVVGREAYEIRRDRIEAALRGEPQRFEAPMPSAHGPRDTEMQYIPRRDADGSVRGLYVIVIDMTERKRSQAALERLNATLEQRVAERTADRDRMWRLSTDLMLVASNTGIVAAINPAWSRLLGWSEAELAGRSYLELLHPDDAAGTRAEMARLSRRQTVYGFENRCRRKDGSYAWISWTAVPEGRFIHAAGRDVTAERAAATELARAQEQLRQSQKMEAVGQLTGGLAHDFNNMLTGIIGSLDLMRRRIAAGRVGELDRYMDAALSSANRAAALTHRLLAFSRRQSLDLKPVDTNALIAAIEELFRRTLSQDILLQTELAEEAWPARTDANQLENALLNLVINARDAMPEGGLLSIFTENRTIAAEDALAAELEPGDYVAVTVADTGTGMPPEVQARAFDPFFTTKPIGQGTGLGLSMIYGYAKQSRGHVVIDSREGIGTEVTLLLPRHPDEAAMPPGAFPLPPLEAARGQGETVLVVEDDPAVRLLVLGVLDDLDYRALEAEDAASALPILESDARIDLMVSDVGLPGLNGRQLADMARSHRPDLKVLFVTGYAEGAGERAGFLGPGMQMIDKPFDIDVLAARIREMLREG